MKKEVYEYPAIALMRHSDKRSKSMEKLNQYQKDQVCLLALYHPYPIRIVEYVFVMCDKSFDKTEKALELGSAYNSIERGINEANITTASI